MPDNIIKQINVGGTLYDLDASFIEGHSWEDITNLASTSFAATVYTSLPAVPTTNQTAKDDFYKEHQSELALVANSSAEAGSYLEYILVKSGTSPNFNYVWEQIGSTKMDLSNYVQKGTYNTSVPSSNQTSNAGGATVNTSNAGSQTATGTATITYDKAAANTGNAGAATVTVSITVDKAAPTVTGSTTGSTSSNTGKAGAATINTSEQTAHTHTVSSSKSTLTYVSGTATGDTGSTATEVNTGSNGAHTHSVTTTAHSHTVNIAKATVTYVSGVTQTNNTGSSHSHSVTINTYSLNGSGNQYMYSPTVSAAGVLSWSMATVSLSAGTTSVNTASGGAHTHGIVPTTATFNNITGITLSTSAPTGTAASAGDHVHEITDIPAHSHTLSSSTLDVVTSVSANTGDAGAHSHSVTIASHSHSYNAPAAHTHAITPVTATYSGSADIAAHSHSITSTATTVTGTASIAVSSHTHSVTIASHTHSLSNHTHSVTL